MSTRRIVRLTSAIACLSAAVAVSAAVAFTAGPAAAAGCVDIAPSPTASVPVPTDGPTPSVIPSDTAFPTPSDTAPPPNPTPTATVVPPSPSPTPKHSPKPSHPALSPAAFAAAAPLATASTPMLCGTVVDGAGAAQPDVRVDVSPAGGSAIVVTRQTDAEGSFSVQVPSGRYDVRLTPPQDSGLRTYLATGISADDSTPLTVVLKPIRIAHVTGTVQDSRGGSYGGAHLVFTPADGGPTWTGNADGSGHYDAEMLAGDYAVTVTADRLHGSVTTVERLAIDQDQRTDLTIPLSTVTVLVRDTASAPVPGGVVSFGGPVSGTAFSGNTSASGAVDAAGTAAIDIVTGTVPNTARVDLASGQAVGFSIPPVQADLTVTVVVPTFQLSGTVVDQHGDPVSAVTVAISGGPSIGVGAQTDSAGHYTLRALSGRYSVSLSGGPLTAGSVTFTQAVTLDRDLSRDLTLPLSTVTVVARTSGGAPIQGAAVAFQGSVSDPAFTGSASVGVRTDGQGQVRVTVPTGTDVRNASLDAGSGLTVPFTIPVVHGDLTVTVTVDVLATVQGTLGDSQGHPFGAASITLTSRDGLPRWSGQADMAGHYSARVLPGDYDVLVSGGPLGSGRIAVTSPLVVDGDRTYDVTVPVSTLSISVRDTRGAPAPTATVGLSGSFSQPGFAGAVSMSAGVDSTGRADLVVPTGTAAGDGSVRLPQGIVVAMPV
ncbi:MAG: Carboxypeptidase regulatory-like domain, partial [Cryptosporangiaceae bacterium]|nr:Carboxypeptidase regulatory-like domain [Cryptosporangiaceae bacterium]